MILRTALFLAIGGTALAASAQHAPSAPYAGHEQRLVAALSEQEIADLRSAAGMTMALPAELNGYPGPKHVLDLAGPLGLTPEQRVVAERLMTEMRARAVPLGEAVIAAEAALDRLFKSGTATPAAIAAASAEVGRLRAELRAVHLVAHLGMRDALSEHQRRAYAGLRGYGGGHGAH
jgi:hypothetical protein